MFRIGEFARICQVTVKTLRYYDKIGLLKPAHCDNFTGYRYYTISQLPRLNRILALKDLGLSLDEIQLILNNALSPEEIRGILKLKAVELQSQIATVQSRLASVEARLRMIEKENDMPKQEVVFKSIPSIRYLSFRQAAENIPRQYQKMGETLQNLSWFNKSRVMGIYHEGDMSVGVILPDDFNESIHVEDDIIMTVVELPPIEKMACLIHKGSYATLKETYQAFWKWINDNGYHITGDCREVYLNNPDDFPEEEWMTEIQYPLER